MVAGERPFPEIPVPGKSFVSTDLRRPDGTFIRKAKPGIKPHSYWDGHGFCIYPRTNKEGKGALDAKNYLSILQGVKEYREMLAAGRSVTDVARYVFEKEGDKITHTYGTVYKYMQLYRRFFIPPMELLEKGEFSVHRTVGRTKSSRKGNGDTYANVLKRKLDQLTNGLSEIDIMEQTLVLQFARVKEQRVLEETLQFPLPNLYKDVEAIQKLAVEIVNLKADLGFNGYLRIPKQIDVNKRHDMSPRLLAALSDDERTKLKAFGQLVVELIEDEDGQFVPPE